MLLCCTPTECAHLVEQRELSLSEYERLHLALFKNSNIPPVHGDISVPNASIVVSGAGVRNTHITYRFIA
jgi:hypothetical protein